MIATGTTVTARLNTSGHAGLREHDSPLHDCFVAKKIRPGTIRATGHSNVPSTFSVCDHVGDFHSRTRATNQPTNGTNSVPAVSQRSALASTRFTAGRYCVPCAVRDGACGQAVVKTRGASVKTRR